MFMAYGGFSDQYPLRHPRRLHERAKRDRNPLQEMGISIDGKILTIQRRLRQSYPLHDESTEITALRTRIRRTLKENKFNGNSTWVDYYRLHAHHDLLAQLIYAPIIFEHHHIADNLPQQEALVADVYTQNMSLLKNAIKEHDHPDAREGERKYLRGTIQEQTAAALLNHPGSPNHLTLPATTINDLAYRTDLVHHTTTTGEYKTVNIQMKSDFDVHTTETDPFYGGITITSGDFGNSYSSNLKTTRALIRQSDGTATQDDYYYLASMQYRLFEKIDQYQTAESREPIAA